MSEHPSATSPTLASDESPHRTQSITNSLRNTQAQLALDPPVILSPQRGTIHKRRASASPDKQHVSKFATFAGSTGGTHDDGSKRARLTEPTVKNEVTAESCSRLPMEKSYGTLGLASVPGTIGQIATQPRSGSGSSTSSSHTARMVLLNKPCAAPLTPGLPGFHFSIFNALLSHTDVLINVVRYLAPRTLVYLYSISAPFHYIVNSHFTQFILASIELWAPRADWFFPWRCYRELCIDDPALRRPTQKWKGFWDRKTAKIDAHKDATMSGMEAPFGVKAVPSFRWLKMVVYREIIAREIVAWLAVAGHPTSVAHTINCVKKLWFMLDIPVSQARIALVHNNAYFDNATLAGLTMFFIKIDMTFTDPINYTGGEHMIRQLLLAERTLTTLWNWLRGAEGTLRVDALQLWVKHCYKRPVRRGPETIDTQTKLDERAKENIMGIPPKLVGRWGNEAFGLGARPLLRPDELVMREGIKRKLDLQRHWLRMMRWGHLDGNLQTVPEVKAEDVVVSLIRRKLSRLEREKQEMAKKVKEEFEREIKEEQMDLDA